MVSPHQMTPRWVCRRCQSPIGKQSRKFSLPPTLHSESSTLLSPWQFLFFHRPWSSLTLYPQEQRICSQCGFTIFSLTFPYTTRWSSNWQILGRQMWPAFALAVALDWSFLEPALATAGFLNMCFGCFAWGFWFWSTRSTRSISRLLVLFFICRRSTNSRGCSGWLQRTVVTRSLALLCSQSAIQICLWKARVKKSSKTCYKSRANNNRWAPSIYSLTSCIEEFSFNFTREPLNYIRIWQFDQQALQFYKP